MEDHSNPASGAGAGDAGGAGSESNGNQENQNSGTQQPKTVSWEAHQRALKDMHKHKSRASELETKLGDVESERLKAENNWKALYEKSEKEKADLQTKYTNLNQWTVHTQRFGEVKQLALAEGLIPQAVADLENFEMDDVQVEVTSGNRFVVNGAKEYVDKLKAEKPYLFKKTGTPNVNAGGGSGKPPAPKALTADDIVQLERDFKRGKVTEKDYRATYNRYLTQK